MQDRAANLVQGRRNGLFEPRRTCSTANILATTTIFHAWMMQSIWGRWVEESSDSYFLCGYLRSPKPRFADRLSPMEYS